jgi:hypothetical protein
MFRGQLPISQTVGRLLTLSAHSQALPLFRTQAFLKTAKISNKTKMTFSALLFLTEAVANTSSCDLDAQE